MYIVETDRISEVDDLPLDPPVFEAKIEELCNESRNKLLNEWLLKCADIFLDERSHWKKYIPKHFGDALCIIEKFFSCVHSLMSLQLRRLVMRSLQHFLKLIVRFKVKFYCLTMFIIRLVCRKAMILAILITI